MSSQTQAVLIGAAVIGVLSALPLVSMGNCCCCLWVVGGGVVTAYLLQQGQPDPIDLGQVTLLGGLAGAVGAFVFAVLSIPVQFLTGPAQERVSELLRVNPDVPPEVLEFINQLSSSGAATILFGFVIMLVAGVLFASLGGLIGGLLFRRNATSSAATPGSSPPVG